VHVQHLADGDGMSQVRGQRLSQSALAPENLITLAHFSVSSTETDLAIDHVARAMRLSPLDPLMFLMQAVTAVAYFVAGRYTEAAEWAAKANREQPSFLGATRNLAASSALCGHLEQAQRALARASDLDPGLRISNLKDRVGPYRPHDFARFAEGMRLAGLPE